MTNAANHFECSETDPDCHALRNESRKQGVSEPANLPFMLCPEGAETAALLVHGFTATPWEMRLLAEALADAGVASLAVCLTGHGTTPEDLASRSWQEWYATVLSGHQALSNKFQSIYAIGMSTGSLLSLMLAAQKPINGVILCSPYLRVLHWLAPFAGWLRWVRPYHHIGNKEHSLYYYNRRPVAGVHQINRLIKHLRGQLTQVECPALAFNGEGDQTVDIDSGRELLNLLGSSVKLYRRYGPEVPHILTREENPHLQEMFAEVIDFIKDWSETPPNPR